jgi:ubiquinone/menaquinone biosynthesis C-methylase UbiE
MPSTENGYLSFDRVADVYEATRYIPPAILQQAARLIVQEMREGMGPLLDAGVGTGRFARYIESQGSKVVGLDIASGMLSQARRASPGMWLVRGDLRALPFGDGVFGGALVVHILHLIREWRQVVRELRRVLAPGAPLIIGSEGGKRLKSRSLFFEIASERGLARPNLGAESVEAILDHLAQTGADIRQFDGGALRWTARTRVRDMLQQMRTNVYSHLWHVEPTAYQDLVAEAERRARVLWPSLSTVEEAPAYVSLWRADWTT